MKLILLPVFKYLDEQNGWIRAAFREEICRLLLTAPQSPVAHIVVSEILSHIANNQSKSPSTLTGMINVGPL